jgi:hypothetical protein
MENHERHELHEKEGQKKDLLGIEYFPIDYLFVHFVTTFREAVHNLGHPSRGAWEANFVVH